MTNAQLTNYIIPTSARHAADRRRCSSRSPTAHGPFGAKGVGELPMDGPAPAIANAMQHATRRASDARRSRSRRSASRRPLCDDRAHRQRQEAIASAAPPMKRLLDVLREDFAAHRHQGRLRRGRVRRLHGAARRRARQLLPGARSARSRGRKVKTVEGLGAPEQLSRLQRRFLERGGAQCGICTPGMLMAAHRHLTSRRQGRRRDGPRRRSPATSAAAPATRRS